MHRRRLKLLATIAVLVLPAAASGQARGLSLDISRGAFQHQSDLHPYFASRFEDANPVGLGISFPLHRLTMGRIAVDWLSTQLAGGPVWTETHTAPDRIQSAEFQVLRLAGDLGGLRPYAGAGAGLRRYTVNTWILADDIVYQPWRASQVQPAVSAIAGLHVELAWGLGVAGEVRWSRARFRAGEDSWGLPEDPVRWQAEFRPAARLDWVIPFRVCACGPRG